ncbi:MAG TPA: zinc ribbon domain-containing protein [Bryobacteraceae bacterium]|nr:zinc ribbon domain-containing protein [Bryobacteraceae bacterium]
MATERRTFYGPDIDLPALARGLSDHFSREGYQTQVMALPNGALMVQAHKEDTFRKIAGMSSALTVVLQMEGEYLGAEAGGARWADKGVAAGVGAIVFFPALITAGVGAYQQTQLQSKAWQFIEQYVRTNSAFGGMPGEGMIQPPVSADPAFTPRRAAPPPKPVNVGAAPVAVAAGVVCSQCNEPLPPGSKFCQACGAPASKTCFACGHELQPTAHFCNNCGSPVRD